MAIGTALTGKGGEEVSMKDKLNKVTTVLKVVVTGEFYDDDATGETLRYAVEQDLDDAGFAVDVTLLKEQEAVVRCRDCKHGFAFNDIVICNQRLHYFHNPDWFCADGKRA